jgi:putative membrane protein
MLKKIILPTLCAITISCLPAYSRGRTAPPNDAAFLAMAAEADMTIAHIGQMAENRAATEKVKDFAKTVVQDHTNDYWEVTELATKTGDKIPKAINGQNERIIAGLDRSKGKAFDREFLSRQSAEHERLISAFKEEAEHGSNPAIKDYARKTLPTIERHLHDTQDLLKQRS